MKYLSKIVLFAALVIGGQSVFAQTKTFDMTDLRKIARVSDPQISPDGKWVVCVVSRANYDENRYEPELVSIDVATRAQKVLMSKRKVIAAPRFSPDGNSLAFLMTADSGTTQIFILPTNGGEARKLSDAAKGVDQFAWRPDGKEIAFVTSDVSEARKGGERFNDAFEVGDNDYLTRETPMPSHIRAIAANGQGAARRLTSGAWSIGFDNYPGGGSPISYTPDGKSILFVEWSNLSVGNKAQTTIQILDLSSGKMKQFNARAAKESAAKFSPDGSRVLYAAPRFADKAGEDDFQDFYVEDADGNSNAVNITKTVDRQMRNAVWMPNGKSILTGGHDGAGTAFWLISIDGKQPHKLDTGAVNPLYSNWLVDASVAKSGAIAFVGTTKERPSEIYLMTTPDAKPVRLTDFQDDFTKTVSLGASESIEWQSDNFKKVDGVLVYPPNFSKDVKYPLAVVIHGGPQTASVDSWQTFYPIAQIVAAHGYVVFLPNYRGSDNRGYEFQQARTTGAEKNRQRDVGGAARDIMNGIAAVEKRGSIDASKIGVSGWSWGGTLTSWIIGHETIFKAAVSGAAINDFFGEYDLSSGNTQWAQEFGGSPYVGENAATYRAASPLTYAAKIKTPTLIMAATGDTTVPVSQSYAMFRALKDNGATVKFIAYPSPQHFPSDPVRQADIYRRWVEWFDAYLK